jgi:hypothetical protein
MTSSSRCSPTTRLPVSTLERQRLASRRLTSISIWSSSIEACDADPCRPRPFVACFREKPCAKRRGPRSSRGWGQQSLGRYSAAQDVLHEERASARLASLEEAADDGDFSSVFGTLHDRCQSREVTPSRIASGPSARFSQRTGLLRRSRRGILAAVALFNRRRRCPPPCSARAGADKTGPTARLEPMFGCFAGRVLRISHVGGRC